MYPRLGTPGLVKQFMSLSNCKMLKPTVVQMQPGKNWKIAEGRIEYIFPPLGFPPLPV